MNPTFREVWFHGLPVLRPDIFSDLIARGLRAVFPCAGSASENEAIARQCDAAGLAVVSALHPRASVSPLSHVGRGVYVGPQAMVGPSVVLEDFARVLACASVAHHGRIGRHAVIADGSHLGGNVSVGAHASVGIGAAVNKRLELGEGCLVVSGATVTDHVPAEHVVRLDASVAPLPRVSR